MSRNRRAVAFKHGVAVCVEAGIVYRSRKSRRREVKVQHLLNIYRYIQMISYLARFTWRIILNVDKGELVIFTVIIVIGHSEVIVLYAQRL